MSCSSYKPAVTRTHYVKRIQYRPVVSYLRVRAIDDFNALFQAARATKKNTLGRWADDFESVKRPPRGVKVRNV